MKGNALLLGLSYYNSGPDVVKVRGLRAGSGRTILGCLNPRRSERRAYMTSKPLGNPAVWPRAMLFRERLEKGKFPAGCGGDEALAKGNYPSVVADQAGESSFQGGMVRGLVCNVVKVPAGIRGLDQ